MKNSRWVQPNPANETDVSNGIDNVLLPLHSQQLTALPHFVTDILLDNQQASETCW